jgi:hypothetical protein
VEEGRGHEYFSSEKPEAVEQQSDARKAERYDTTKQGK